MKSVLKLALMVFASTYALQVFAITEINRDEMRSQIQKLKADISKECSSEVSQFALSKVVSSKCSKSEIFLQTQFCNRKNDLVLFLEGVMSERNVVEVTKHFSEQPPEDALGGVLLYQMRTSIDQISETWARQVKSVPAKCVTGDLKGQMKLYTSGLRADLGQTRLFVKPPVIQ